MEEAQKVIEDHDKKIIDLEKSIRDVRDDRNQFVEAKYEDMRQKSDRLEQRIKVLEATLLIFFFL